jgi:hypothetical protein
MQCIVKRKVSAYLDNAVSERERLEIRKHLASCGACSRESDRMIRVRSTLRALPRQTMPADLTVRLRVVASREHARRRSLPARLAQWFDHTRMAVDTLMRTLALPFAGGVLSAVILFMTLVPTFTFSRTLTGDVPTGLSTEPTVKNLAPIGFTYGDAEVDLTIDGQGRIVKYTIVGSEGVEKEGLRRSIENNLLFTEFVPATAFGMPTPGTVRLSFRSSRIEVKG